VVPSELTIEVAKRLARQIAAKPPVAVRLAKDSVNQALETPLQQGLAAERRSFYFLFATEDQKEGMRAFLEKRRGEFKGR
jgi:enoyl-CoA hydratase